jgi:hypothetical protein
MVCLTVNFLGRQQVYARIISPGLRPAGANVVHQNTATAVTLQSTTSEASAANPQVGAGPSSSMEQ